MAKLLKDGHFFCVDKKALKESLFGSWERGTNNRALDIGLFACASEFKLHDGTVTGGDDSCIWDEMEVKRYVSSGLGILVYHNQSEFVQDQYGEEKIVRKSSVASMFSSSAVNVWTSLLFNSHEMTDEVDYLQLGQYDQIEFSTTQIGNTEPSHYNKWPTRDNPTIFKFNGAYVEQG